MEIKDIYELKTRFDSRQSFYGKAHVIVCDNGDRYLRSYSTIVAAVINNKCYCNGIYSQTTTRHTKEFFRQETGDILNIKQLKELPFIPDNSYNFSL